MTIKKVLALIVLIIVAPSLISSSMLLLKVVGAAIIVGVSIIAAMALLGKPIPYVDDWFKK